MTTQARSIAYDCHACTSVSLLQSNLQKCEHMKHAHTTNRTDRVPKYHVYASSQAQRTGCCTMLKMFKHRTHCTRDHQWMLPSIPAQLLLAAQHAILCNANKLPMPRIKGIVGARSALGRSSINAHLKDVLQRSAAEVVDLIPTLCLRQQYSDRSFAAQFNSKLSDSIQFTV